VGGGGGGAAALGRASATAARITTMASRQTESNRRHDLAVLNGCVGHCPLVVAYEDAKGYVVRWSYATLEASTLPLISGRYQVVYAFLVGFRTAWGLPVMNWATAEAARRPR
jgi:hypothetical protein